MAYGKDPATRGTGGSFRQRAHQHQERKEKSRKGRGGGGGFYWASQYKPPIDDVDTIRILEATYAIPQIEGKGDEAKVVLVDLPFYPYVEHYDGREEKSAICSAGPWQGDKNKQDPCAGCDLFWANMEKDANTGKKKAGRMSRREMQAFSLVDYGIYHNVEQIDHKTNQLRINENTGKPWMNWEKCEGQGCIACRSGKETRRGASRHWGLGWGHYNTLLDVDEQIGKSCNVCRQRDCIGPTAWICAACGVAIVDYSTTSMKHSEIKELTSKSNRCQCGFEGFLTEIIECRNCTPHGGSPKRATIFDVDMNVKRVKSSDGNQTTLLISQWSEPRPVDPNFVSYAKPMDLPSIYAPTPIDNQRTLFKSAQISNRHPVTSADASRPYGGQAPPMTAPQQPPMAAPPPMTAPPMMAPGMQFPQQAAPPPPPAAPPAMSGSSFLGLPPPPGTGSGQGQ